MKTLTKLHKTIIKKYGVTPNNELAKELGLSNLQLAGNIGALKRFGHIENIKPIKPIKVIKKTKKKTNITKSMSSDNLNKDKARQYIFNAILLSGLHNGNLLTLPCNTWKIEENLLNNLSDKFKILGVEFDKKVYIKSGRKLFKTPTLFNNCSLINGTIGEQIFKSSENEFAHLILDYCGGFSTYAKEITFAMREKIVQVGGTISMTFSERALGDYGRAILDTFGGDGEYKSVTAFKHFINGVNMVLDSNYSIETSYRYKGGEKGKKGDNMVLFIIKRNK